MTSSRSSSSTSQETEDSRVAGDNGAIGISSDGSVVLNMVADEAFELGVESLLAMRDLSESTLQASGDALTQVSDTIANALTETQEAQTSELKQIGSDLINVGIPVAALAYVAAKVLK